MHTCIVRKIKGVNLLLLSESALLVRPYDLSSIASRAVDYDDEYPSHRRI